MERSGFTLTEVVVALLLLSVGVGAVAATAACGASMVSEGGALEAEAWAAWRLMEELRAAGCPASRAGLREWRGAKLEWAVWEDGAAGARRIQVVVRAAHDPPGSVTSFGTAVCC